jgi:hypothetical protein
MTDAAVLRRPSVLDRFRESTRARNPRAWEWLRAHKTSLIVCLPLLAVVGFVHMVGMASAPSIVDDEGTYVAQAWAIENWGTLAHYTYWYDHPPLGWVQIAGWTWLTQAFDRADLSVLAGREAMAVAKVISAGLLYVLARRLGLARAFACVAVVLFAFSPLAVEFQRSVYLDNVAIPWLLGAFVLAASPRKHLAAAAGSAICFAIAVLSKETTLILLPALGLMLWQTNDVRTRRLALTIAGTLFAALVALYPLYAVLKGELFPGDDHVSLLWSAHWQLFSRPSSGSLLDASSAARDVVDSWLRLDKVLVATSLVALPFALITRRIRPIGVALAIQLVMMLRDGYLPYPYIIAIAPFAALVVAGVADTAWREWRHVLSAKVGMIVAAVAAVAFLVPVWGSALYRQSDQNLSAPTRQTVEWLTTNASRDSTLVVEDSIWVDLVESGWAPNRVIWFYKLDLDPAVHLPNGWRDVDYIAIGDLSPELVAGLPLNQQVIENSKPVATFGEGPGAVTIREVVK